MPNQIAKLTSCINWRLTGGFRLKCHSWIPEMSHWRFIKCRSSSKLHLVNRNYSGNILWWNWETDQTTNLTEFCVTVARVLLLVLCLSQTVTFYLSVSSWPANRFQIVYNPSRDFISPRESGGEKLKFFEKWEIFLWCMIDVRRFCEVSSEASPFECEGWDCKYFLIPELGIKTISHNN